MRASPSNSVDGDLLLEMDERTLEACGVRDILHQKKILRAIRELKYGHATPGRGLAALPPLVTAPKSPVTSGPVFG
jgi:hypothetical protein